MRRLLCTLFALCTVLHLAHAKIPRGYKNRPFVYCSTCNHLIDHIADELASTKDTTIQTGFRLNAKGDKIEERVQLRHSEIRVMEVIDSACDSAFSSTSHAFAGTGKKQRVVELATFGSPQKSEDSYLEALGSIAAQIEGEQKQANDDDEALKKGADVLKEIKDICYRLLSEHDEDFTELFTTERGNGKEDFCRNSIEACPRQSKSEL